MCYCYLLLLCVMCSASSSLKEFSLARFSDIAVYANNSVITIHLVGEGFEEPQITDGGALECHTDDTNCCRSTDGMAGGEWYDSDGNRVLGANENRVSGSLYRTRSHMVIRLNRPGGESNARMTGLYRCEIPSAEGVNITRYITLTLGENMCADLFALTYGEITYTPPRHVSPGSHLRDDHRHEGTIATYSCSSGYQLVGGSTQRACVGGTWNGTQPSCVLCSGFTNPPNGQVSIENLTATYTCDTGYTLVGSPSRTCGADGNWTSMEPTCQIVDCGPLTAPDHGQVDTSSGTTFGSTATYSCDLGYTLIGSMMRTCDSTGAWSFNAPTCQIVDCGPLTAPANGQVDTSSGTTFGNTATYTCDTGYTLVDSSSRTCGADGNWTPTAPVCEIKDCGLLTLPSNGQVDTSSGTTFESTATYTCDDGFTLSGLGTTTCGAAGNWTTAIPVCERVIFQLRFGPLDCIQYSSSDSLQRIEALSAELVDNVVRLCSCHFNSSFLLDPQLQCFHKSPQIVTFRAQLLGGIQITATKLVPYIQEWINSSQHFTLNGVRLSFNKSCDLVIPSFHADECPITAVTTPEPTSPTTHLLTTDQPPSTSATTNIGVITGGALAGVSVIVVITGITIGLFFYCRRKFTIVRKEDTSHENNKHEIIEEDAEYEEIEDLREQLGTRGQPHPPKGNDELTQCAAYNPIIRSNH